MKTYFCIKFIIIVKCGRGAQDSLESSAHVQQKDKETLKHSSGKRDGQDITGNIKGKIFKT